MERRFNFTIDKSIMEHDREIMAQVDNEEQKFIAIFAPMGTYKTEWFKTNLVPYAKKTKNVLVMVNPSTAQGEQMGQDERIECVLMAGKQYFGEDIIVTTPESMYKAMNNLIKANQKFILVTDEAHEYTTSKGFRDKITIPRKYEKYATKVIHMTATPEPLFNYEYDCILDFELRNPIEVKSQVVRCEKINASLLVNQAIKAINAGENLVICNDNKKMNKVIMDTLVQRYGEKTLLQVDDLEHDPEQIDLFTGVKEQAIKSIEYDNFTVVSSDDRKGKAYDQLINGQWPEGIKVIVTTSFIKAGLNINNPDNTRMIITGNVLNFLLADKVQQMGRLRNRKGISRIDLIIPNLEIPQGAAYLPLETMAEEITGQVMNCYEMVKMFKGIPSDELLELACCIYDAFTNQYVIDQDKLNAKIYKEYCRQLIYWPNRLKIDLERVAAIDLNVSFIEMSEEVDQEVESGVKEAQENAKAAHEVAKKEILTMDEHTREIVFNVLYDDLDKLREPLRTTVKNYYDNMPDSTRKLIRDVKNRLTDGDKAAAHMKVLTESKAAIQREFDQLEALKINSNFNDIRDSGVDLEKTIKKIPGKAALTKRLFFIRYKLQDLEKKQGRLSNKRVNQLAQMMIDENHYKGKKINLEKAREMLLQDLRLIYTMRTDAKGSKISSIK